MHCVPAQRSCMLHTPLGRLFTSHAGRHERARVHIDPERDPTWTPCTLLGRPCTSSNGNTTATAWADCAGEV